MYMDNTTFMHVAYFSDKAFKCCHIGEEHDQLQANHMRAWTCTRYHTMHRFILSGK